MKKIVISSSEYFYKEAKEWKTKLENMGHIILGHVEQVLNTDIIYENFLDKYENFHKEFYKKILEADILLVLNLDKGNIYSYIGPSVFAEIAFTIGLNISLDKNIDIYCLNPIPLSLSYSYELNLWRELGWIKICDEYCADCGMPIEGTAIYWMGTSARCNICHHKRMEE